MQSNFGAVNGAVLSPSNGNLTLTSPSGSSNFCPVSIPVSSGKWYVEVTAAGSGTASTCGVWKADIDHTTNYYQNPNYRYWQNDGNIYDGNGGTSANYGITWAAGDVVGIALDMDNGKVFFSKNGTFLGTSNPVTGANPAASGLTESWVFALQSGSGTNHTLHINTGQRSYANSVPTGYKSLCTQNFDDPGIKDPSKHFDTKLYVGNGGYQDVGGPVYSAGATATGGFESSNPAKNAFNGILTSGNRANGVTVGGTIEIVFNPGLSVSSTVGIWSGKSGFKYQINNSGSYTSVTNAVEQWHDASFSGTLTNLKIQHTASNEAPGISGIRVDGSTLYDGNGDPYNFSPDFVWTKARSVAHWNILGDTIRGPGPTSSSNTTYTEWNDGLYQSFNSNGFTVAQVSSNQSTNGNNQTHVGWAWDAGSSNTSISVGSLNSSVYDQSQVWSNYLTTNETGTQSYCNSGGFFENNGSGHMATEGFNGSLTTTTATCNDGDGKRITFTPPSAYAYTSKVEVYLHGSQTNSVYINGNDTGVDTVANSWATVATGSGSITSMWFESDTAGHAARFAAIRIDGKLLVDQGVSVTNVPSIASIVRVNQTAGFSIVTFTAASGAGNTVSHGLNTKPAFFFYKNLDYAQNWGAYHGSLGANYGFNFNTPDGKYDDAGYFNDVEPTSSLITFGTYPGAFGNHDHVLYAFNTVEGYSAVGSYTGNGAEDGPFIYTGFRPRWILIKSHYASNTNSHNHWGIYDTERNTGNEASNLLLSSADGVELNSSHTGIDIMSNGFKLRGDSGGYANYNTNQFVYFAIAENPFKYARAR